MNWEDEPYIRLYTRDTAQWKLLGWQGQAVFALLLRKMDRAGVIELEDDDPVRSVCALLDMHPEIVRPALEKLLGGSKPVLEQYNGCLVCPNFLEAQTARQSDKARQKASRERRRDTSRRDKRLAGQLTLGLETGVTKRDGTVTNRDTTQNALPITPASNVLTKRDGSITNRDTLSQNQSKPSHGVTLSLAQLSLADPTCMPACDLEGKPTSTDPPEQAGRREKKPRRETIHVSDWAPSAEQILAVTLGTTITDSDVTTGLIDMRDKLNADMGHTEDWLVKTLQQFAMGALRKREGQVANGRDGSTGSGSASKRGSESRPMAQATAGDFTNERHRLHASRSRL